MTGGRGLVPYGALPPYLGGKRRLAPLIFALLAETRPRASWPGLAFLDPCCGGGAVAHPHDVTIMEEPPNYHLTY